MPARTFADGRLPHRRAAAQGEGERHMFRIELNEIPLLDDAAALFGAVIEAGGQVDDRVFEIMVYLYEILPK